MSSPLRLLWAAAAAALVLAAVGVGWEIQRFGLSGEATAARLERDVRQLVAERSSEIHALAGLVAAERELILNATASRDALPDLFGRLAALTEPAGADRAATTVYVPEPPGTHRILAWSDGPADVVGTQLLSGPAALFVAPGTAGLRLAFVQPIDVSNRHVAIAVAETVLSAASQTGEFTLDTRFGPVTVVPAYADADVPSPAPGVVGFVITAPRTSAPLVEIRFAPSDLALHRRGFRYRVLAIAGLPLAILPVLFVGPLLDRRRRSRATRSWLGWSGLAVLAVAAAAFGLAGLSRVAGAPPIVGTAILILAFVGGVAIVAGGWWWRRGRREMPPLAPLRFAAEHLGAGLSIAATIVAIAALLSRRITPASLARWQSALFPFDPVGLLEIWSLLGVALGLCWATASVVAIVARRWRLTPRRTTSLLALILWLIPIGIVLVAAAPPVRPPAASSLCIAGALALFALVSTSLRHYYRRTTQTMRLLLGFLALLVPLLTIYPMIAVVVDRTTRAVIEREYGPQTARQSDEIRAILARTQAEIDRLATLPDQVRTRTGQPVDSQTAFRVWSETSLSRTRVISDVELYGSDRKLISRFTLNFPDYRHLSSARLWEGEGRGCQWEVSGEVTRFGSIDRAMLNAQRGLCDATGKVVGAVVLHVAPTDYRALPFVASANPYAEILGVAPSPARRVGPPELEIVVYGWSLQPLFTSSRVAWALSLPIFTRLYREGQPFWTSLDAEGRTYHVYFLQNRTGMYALGYPRLTGFEHAARLAEMAAVTAVLFVLIQLTTVLYAPMARRANAPLRVLLHEIRTSFYRKLFLFFVLVAIGPVFLFALAFGTYMASKFRTDVESEAETVVTSARRVFEQVASAEQPLEPLTDDVMVWIRQVIDEDVNLFEGSELVATSQRDLFNSGLLPTRTPALLFRKIALDRLPTFVAEDRQYLVAASPLPARGRDAILSVPLAPRQREIADEIDALYRGVLVGSVLVVLFSAGLGASLAGRVSDPVARLTKATRQIAAGRLDVRIAADTADELRRLVDDFNTMTATLVAQRAELARTNQLKAWNEMARQVAHEIKNPLTPIQLAAEHLQRVHTDRGQPLGLVFDQCVQTVLGQVRLLRRIASEFANFAAEPRSRPELIHVPELAESVVGPYRLGVAGRVQIDVDAPRDLPPVRADRRLLVRALTNLVENAIQAMPEGGMLTITARAEVSDLVLTIADTGVGMDAETISRAFEPHFSTKTAGSGLGLVNARRTIELEGGTIALESAHGTGTTVTITLPLAALPDAPAGGPTPSRETPTVDSHTTR